MGYRLSDQHRTRQTTKFVHALRDPSMSKHFAKRYRCPRSLRVEMLQQRHLLAADPVIGVNVDPIVDFSTAWTFTDAFKTSRPWISHAFNTVTGQESFSGGGEVQVDDNGWPIALNEFYNDQGELIQQRISTLMFRDIGDKFPAGIYRAEWKGTGTVKWQFAASTIETGTMPDGTHYALLDVTPRNAGISMRIESIDTADPIRDVRLWMPEHEGQNFDGQVWSPGESFSPFHPAFLESLEPFSTLRFMDWMDTNRSSLVDWEDRRSVDDARQRGEDRGIAPEYIIELANTLQKNVWLNVPHQATDDFVSNYAAMFRDALDPDLKIYVEYSNEVWNGRFDAFNWITEQLPGGDEALRWEVTAGEAKRDFDIWSNVFTGQENRFVRVGSGFPAVSSVTDSILSNMEGKFDAIEVASYVGLTDAQRAELDASTTADEILDLAFQNLESITFPRIDAHVELAEQYSEELGREIDLVIYEGGQLLLPQDGNSPYLQAIYDAQSSPRMYDLYQALLEGLDHRGIDAFNHFTHVNRLTANSTTGALQYQLQPIQEAPKYQALADAPTHFFQPELSVEGTAVTEGLDEFAEFTVSFDDPTSLPFNVEIALTDQTANGLGVDFGNATGPQLETSIDNGTTWIAGDLFQVPPDATGFLIRVPIVDDDEVEYDETFALTVTAAESVIEFEQTIISDDIPDIESNLVAHWTFEPSSGIAQDQATEGTVSDDGAYVGNAVSTPSGILQLGGAGDQVNVATSTDLNSGIFSQRTVSLFFYAEDTSRRQVLFEEGGQTRGLNIYVEDGELIVGGWNRSSFQSGWQGTWLSTPIINDHWHHVALVLDGDSSLQSDAMIGYLDGVEFDRGAGSQLWSHTDPIGIGGVNQQARFGSDPPTDASNTNFSGFVDDVRIYNRAITEFGVFALAETIPESPNPVIEIEISDSTALEGDTILFDVDLSEAVNAPIALELELVGNSATEVVDFGSISIQNGFTFDGSVVVIPPSTTSFQFSVPTVSDDDIELPETFYVLGTVVEGMAFPIEPATGLIDNDDFPAPGDGDSVAFWSLNEVISGKVIDTAIAGTVDDDGTVVGNANIDTDWGRDGAIALDGQSRVAVATSTDINNGVFLQRSISLWFNAEDTQTRQILYEEGALTTGLNLYLDSGQLVVGGWRDSGRGNGWIGTWLETDVVPGKWNHVVLTLDTSGEEPGTLTGYLNGVSFGFGEAYALTPHTDPIGIGAAQGGARYANATSTNFGANPFTGHIDEVEVFNRSLSPLEIANIASEVNQFANGPASGSFARQSPEPSGFFATDVNKDSKTTALDALLLINWLGNSNRSDGQESFDVNQDGRISSLDALIVINQAEQIDTASETLGTNSITEYESEDNLELIDLAMSEFGNLF